MKVKQSLLKYISPTAPEELKLQVARATPPEPLKPVDQLTALVVLLFDKSALVSGAAKKGLAEYPAESVVEALEKKLDPLVIKKAVAAFPENDAVLIMAASNPAIDDETLKTVLATGPEEVAGVFLDEIERVRARPFILDALRQNAYVPESTIQEIERLAAEPPSDDAAKPKSSDELVEALKTEGNKEADESNIYQVIKDMSMGQKIKLALSGNKSSRGLLIRDSNKMISIAVLKNPRITEDEVLKVANTKGTPEDLLRLIARNKEWIKSYTIKMGVISNPKTPLAISIKLMDSLYENDLQKIAKSKNIPSALASNARRKLEAKGKK